MPLPMAPSTMDVMGIKEEELIDGVELGGVGAYLGDAEEDAEVLVINASAFHQLADENIYVKCFGYQLATTRFSDVMWAMTHRGRCGSRGTAAPEAPAPAPLVLRPQTGSPSVLFRRRKALPTPWKSAWGRSKRCS